MLDFIKILPYSYRCKSKTANMEIAEENKNCMYYKGCSHKDCDSYCVKWSKISYYAKMGFIPQDRMFRVPLILDETKQDEKAYKTLGKIEKNIVNFVEGSGQLYIYSKNVGNGKTSWAMRLLFAYMGNNTIWPKKPANEPVVMFISVPKLIQDMRTNMDTPVDYIEQVKKYIETVDLVVWDDIGFKNATEYEVSYLLNWINQRIENGKANIYTSNVSPKELTKVLGDRLTSRTCECSTIVQFKEADKRSQRKKQ